MNIELKKIKIIKSMSQETTCFTADLWIDGEKAAYVSNRGTGGANFYHFFDKNLQGSFFAYCKSLNPLQTDEYKHLFPNGLPMDADLLVGELLEKHQQIQWFKRQTKNKTLVKLCTHKRGDWMIYNVSFTPEVGQKIRQKHGNELVLIANEDIEKAAAI